MRATRRGRPTSTRGRTAGRAGLSLTEVLVALFIMGLGSLAILTLFPFGALQMAQAIKDDRTGQAAAAADAFLRSYWKTEVVEGSGSEPFVLALDDANNGLVGNGPGGQRRPTLTAVAANDIGPSYPVAIDPMGFVAPRAVAPKAQYWIGGRGNGPVNSLNTGQLNPATGAVPRRTLTVPSTGANRPAMPALQAIRSCSMLDGYSFNPSGSPVKATTTDPAPLSGLVERELRYNWLWIVQRPVNRVRATANLTVVVFDKRAPQFVPPHPEAHYDASASSTSAVVGFVPGQTVVVVPNADRAGLPANYPARPQIQKGAWVMDATVGPGVRHANFYRVVSVTQGNTDTTLELQTPIKRTDGGTAPYNGTLVVLTGVSEVFERPQLTAGEVNPQQ